MHINAHPVEAAAHTPAVNIHIDNMPEGGTPAADSVTTAMLQNGAVTNDKVAQDAVGTSNIKNGAVTKAKLAADAMPQNATTAAPGIVKQAAKVDNCASGDGATCQASINAVIKALKAAGIMASA